MMDDRTRLALLYSAMPETEEQAERRAKLIKELRLRLNIKKPSHDAMVVNGEIDDIDMLKGNMKR